MEETSGNAPNDPNIPRDQISGMCNICTYPLNGPCPMCRVQHNDECNLAWGCCGHSFHGHCIQGWLLLNPFCPADQKVWIYKV